MYTYLVFIMIMSKKLNKFGGSNNPHRTRDSTRKAGAAKTRNYEEEEQEIQIRRIDYKVGAPHGPFTGKRGCNVPHWLFAKCVQYAGSLKKRINEKYHATNDATFIVGNSEGEEIWAMRFRCYLRVYLSPILIHGPAYQNKVKSRIDLMKIIRELDPLLLSQLPLVESARRVIAALGHTYCKDILEAEPPGNHAKKERKRAKDKILGNAMIKAPTIEDSALQSAKDKRYLQTTETASARANIVARRELPKYLPVVSANGFCISNDIGELTWASVRPNVRQYQNPSASSLRTPLGNMSDREILQLVRHFIPRLTDVDPHNVKAFLGSVDAIKYRFHEYTVDEKQAIIDAYPELPIPVLVVMMRTKPVAQYMVDHMYSRVPELCSVVKGV